MIRNLAKCLCLAMTALAASWAYADAVSTARLGSLHPKNGVVVTNVTFEGLAESSNVYTKAETEAKIVELAPAPGDYAAVSNAAMNAATRSDLAAATNGIPRITESESNLGWAENAERAETAGEAGLSTEAQYADEAEYALYLSEGDDKRDATAIFSQLDAATATNAAQQAALAGKASTNDVALTPVYGGSGERFGDWVVDNSEVYVEWNVYNSCWFFVKYDTSEMPFAFRADEPDCYDVNATSIAYHDEIDATATRTENPIIGYTLGSQTDKVLASTNLQTGVSESAVTNIVRDLSLGGIWDSALNVWWTPRMRNGSLTYEATTNVNLNAGN